MRKQNFSCIYLIDIKVMTCEHKRTSAIDGYNTEKDWFTIIMIEFYNYDLFEIVYLAFITIEIFTRF